MVAQLTHDVFAARTDRTLSADDTISWDATSCPFCGVSPMFVMAVALDGIANAPVRLRTSWLRCQSCRKGAVRNDELLSPAPAPTEHPQGLPENAALLWDALRSSLGAGACGAVALFARSLIGDLLVYQSLQIDITERAEKPFTAAVEHLVRAGVLTARFREWSERLADPMDDVEGRFASITVEVADDIAHFVARVLMLTFDVDASLR